MGKLIKWIFGLLIFVVIVVVAAVIVLPMVVDPNDHKDKIVDAVKDQTGRDLAITEDLKLSVFPWIGIETGGVTLSNAKGFGDAPFAKIRQLGVRVKLLPLLSRQVEVDTLVLDGMHLNLAQKANGTNNWEDLLKPSDEALDKSSDKEDDSEGTGLVSLKIQGVQIEDAQVSWRDDLAGQSYILKNVRLTTGILAAGKSVPLEAGFSLNSTAPALDVVLKVEGEVTANDDFTHYIIAGLKIELEGKGEGLPAEGMQLAIASEVDLDLSEDRLQLTDLELQGPQVALNGQLDVKQLQAQPAINGQIKLAKTNVKQLAALFGSKILTQDEAALTQVSADITLKHEGKVLKLDPLKVQLDDSSIAGYVHVLNPEGPILRSKMDIDKLDVDRYLPPQGDADEAKSETGQAAASDDPFAALRTLDLQAELRIASLVANKAKLSDVLVKVVSKSGVLKVDPLTANLYEGKISGKTTLDVRSKTMKVHQVQHLTDVQIGSLLKDVVGEDRLLGRGEIHADIRTQGSDDVAIKKNLNGKANFVFANGAFKGVNVAELIRGASAGLGGGDKATATNQSNQTDFTDLRASLTIKNGVVNNSDLKANSPLLRISGKGTVDLPAEKINYLLTTELVASLEGQGGKGADQLSGLPIPVKITGSFSDPKYRPDLEGLLNAKAKQRIDEEKKKLRAKAEDKVKEKLGGALKGLFGR